MKITKNQLKIRVKDTWKDLSRVSKRIYKFNCPRFTASKNMEFINGIKYLDGEYIIYAKIDSKSVEMQEWVIKAIDLLLISNQNILIPKKSQIIDAFYTEKGEMPLYIETSKDKLVKDTKKIIASSSDEYIYLEKLKYTKLDKLDEIDDSDDEIDDEIDDTDDKIDKILDEETPNLKLFLIIAVPIDEPEYETYDIYIHGTGQNMFDSDVQYIKTILIDEKYVQHIFSKRRE